MKMSEKQKSITRLKQKSITRFLFAQPGHTATKKELVDQFCGWFYYNESKHIGDVLSRMVDRGMIVRPRRGVYKLSYKLESNYSNVKAKEIQGDPGQLNLFNEK